jgi:hypothetical protein
MAVLVVEEKVTAKEWPWMVVIRSLYILADNVVAVPFVYL